jgi:ribosomal protein S18 acetylase RimI-like enzyme
VGRREPIGRLYVDRWADQIRLVDIALLPEHRGAGLGRAILEELLAEGERRGLPVTIHVEYNNPALRLYRRLGFRHVDSNGIYYLMRWEPTPPGAPSGAGRRPS